MKKLFFSLIAVLAFTFAFAQQASTDVAVFESEVVDMGKIPAGTPATVTFIVKNVGKTPLIIETAQPTCGCTIGNFTKEPIAPGKTGEITATYNAASVAPFEKHMNVKFAGYSDNRSVTIKGEVVTAEEYAKIKPATPAVAASVAVKPAPAKVVTKTKTSAGTKKTKVKTKA